MKKRFLYNLYLVKIGLNINLPAFNVDILKYIVILLVYQMFGIISYVVIGDK